MEEVQSQLRHNALSVLGENISRQWFNAMNASIRAKQLMLHHRKGTPEANSPSTKLLRKALELQQANLADNQHTWRQDTGDDCDYESACPHLSLTAELESRSRTARARPATLAMARLTQLEQCLMNWQPPWSDSRRQMYAMTDTSGRASFPSNHNSWTFRSGSGLRRPRMDGYSLDSLPTRFSRTS